MRWPQTKRIANEGVLHVESVVNSHGSIFRPVPQETDVGIDGYIELVDDHRALGKLIAVQIKSGESYVATCGTRFAVDVDSERFNYWSSYLLQVVLICYSPARGIAAWTSIRQYAKRHEYHHPDTPIKCIEIPFSSTFNAEALGADISQLAEIEVDRRALVACADLCLSAELPRDRLQGLTILSEHPDSEDSRLTAFLARRLLFDDDSAVATRAIRTLAFHAGRYRWSWNPNNARERQLIDYASRLCEDFSKDECRRLIERIDDECFGGPKALGERVFDLLACCDLSFEVMQEIAADAKLPMQRRINALYMALGCENFNPSDHSELATDSTLGDVYLALLDGDST